MLEGQARDLSTREII